MMSSPNGQGQEEKRKMGEKHRGWPKGKRRRVGLKDQNAPRRPVNGYVRYMAEKREAVSAKNPNLSFADVTKILGNQWSSLPPEDKKKYLDDAETDRAAYMKKMKMYRQSPQYKERMEKLSTSDSKERTDGKLELVKHSPSTSNVRSKTTPPPMVIDDIPIFTEEFLDHNKAKDSELRQLRKSNAEYEEQNTILHKHIDNLQNAIKRLDDETHTQRQNNYRLQVKLRSMKEMLVNVFKDLPLPESGQLPTISTAESYMKQVFQILQTGAEKHQKFAASVQEVMLKLDRQELLHLKT